MTVELSDKQVRELLEVLSHAETNGVGGNEEYAPACPWCGAECEYVYDRYEAPIHEADCRLDAMLTLLSAGR